MNKDVWVCKTCLFWKRYKEPRKNDVRYGQCRRYPPALLDEEPRRKFRHAYHPDTHEEHWCGEWQKDENAN